jgi:alkylation response protein AidB-like acyl-CoA dehydrogenase
MESGKVVSVRRLESGTYLDKARSIAELVRAEATVTEEGGTLSPAVVDALSSTELFWMLAPREVGGGGCLMTEAIDAIEEVSRADGSAGWTLMANSGGICVAGTFAGDSAIDAMFGGSAKPIVAGMFGPGGKADAVAEVMSVEAITASRAARAMPTGCPPACS